MFFNSITAMRGETVFYRKLYRCSCMVCDEVDIDNVVIPYSGQDLTSIELIVLCVITIREMVFIRNLVSWEILWFLMYPSYFYYIQRRRNMLG